MIIDIKFNEYNLRTNIKNIKDFNYLSFNELEWQTIGAKLGKCLPKGYKHPYKLDIEATKINPIVKMYFAFNENGSQIICIKLTPYEVMVSNHIDDRFKYNRRVTREWQSILQKAFGESYETAKNRHYGIKTL